MKKIILLALLLSGCAVYNTPGYYPRTGYYVHSHNLHNPYLRHPDPYNHHFHSW